MNKSLFLLVTLSMLLLGCTLKEDKINLVEQEVADNYEVDPRSGCESIQVDFEVERVPNTMGDPNSTCTDLKFSVTVFKGDINEYCTIEEVSFKAYTAGTVQSPGPSNDLATLYSNSSPPLLSPDYTFREFGIDGTTNGHYIILDGDQFIANDAVYVCIDYIELGGCDPCIKYFGGSPPNGNYCLLVPPHCP